MAQAVTDLEDLTATAAPAPPAAAQPVRAPRAFNPPLSRDARDVAMNYKLLGLVLLQTLIILVLAGVMLWLLNRKPDLVVIDDTTDKRVVLNNREFGTSPSAALLPNQLLDRDKIAAAKRFLALRYNVDQQTLGKDTETALSMVYPQTAQVLSTYWTKCDGTPDCVTIAQQRAENWQAIWTPQTITIDARDKYLVHVIGVQQVTRTVNNQVENFEKQFQFHVKLVVDKAMKKEQGGDPRSERNFNTGFLILQYTGEQIKNPS